MILGSQAHIYFYEAGGVAALGGIVMTPIHNTEDGEIDLDDLRSEIEPPPPPTHILRGPLW